MHCQRLELHEELAIKLLLFVVMAGMPFRDKMKTDTNVHLKHQQAYFEIRRGFRMDKCTLVAASKRVGRGAAAWEYTAASAW